MAYHWGITSQLKATVLRVVHSPYLQKVFQHTEIQPLLERKFDVILKNKVLQNKFTQICVTSNSVGETEPRARKPVIFGGAGALFKIQLEPELGG